MKMHVPMVKPQPWVIPVTIVCLAFGGFIASLYSAAASGSTHIDVTKISHEQLALLYAQALTTEQAQQKEIEDQRAKVSALLDRETMGNALQKEINDLRVRAGGSPVQGEGILLTLDDTGNGKNTPLDPNVNLRVVHDSDLFTLVNELRSAGAEAIAVNDQRVISSTAIRCAGPVIQVNGTQVAPPFRIRAIGKADTLYGAINMPGGDLELLRQLGIKVTAIKKHAMVIPAIKILPLFAVGKPVPDNTPASDGTDM